MDRDSAWWLTVGRVYFRRRYRDKGMMYIDTPSEIDARDTLSTLECAHQLEKG